MFTKSSSRLKRTGLSIAAAAAVCVALPSQAESIIGLTTTNALFTFDSAMPNNGSTLNSITGLQVINERILGIDLRTTTGVLYGVSSEDRVYTLTTAGVATFVSSLSQPLASDVIGVDFNPMADLAGMTSLRIVSSTGQNLAYNVVNGMTTVGSNIQASFAAVAYSNNDLNAATATSLYYIDTQTDTLKVAPNFNAPTITTVGSLGFDANGVAGFDISGVSGTAFAAMTDRDTGKSGLYTVNLGTGSSTLVGAFGIGGNTAIAPALLGLTVAAIPEPGTYAMLLAGLAAVGFVARRRAQQQG